MSRTVRAAIVQAETPTSLASGLETTRARAHEARAAGASLVVFPETWLPGYPAWLDWCSDAGLWDHAPTKAVFRRMAEDSVDVSGDSGSALASIARDLSLTLVIGVTERVSAGRGRGTLYNSLLMYGPDGALLNHHRKLVPTYTERLVWGPGDTRGLRAAVTPSGRVGGLVCWEHWMPLTRQAMHESGEDIHIAVWPTVHEMHQVASRHYAFEGRCFVLASGALMRADALPSELPMAAERVREGSAWILRGGSAAYAPDGALIAGPIYDEPALLTVDLDLGRVREESMTLDVAGHYARPDALEFRVLASPERGDA